MGKEMKVHGSLVLILVACVLILASCRPYTPTPAPSTTSTLSPSTSGLDWASHVVRPYDDHAELIGIGGGTFTMGSDDATAEVDQKPAHAVSVAGFQIYSHEVTNAMYAECVRNHACMAPGLAATKQMLHFIDPEYEDHPVVGVDWNMAADYCEWVGGRLPTEAEWEFAARGTTGSVYPWGNNLPTCDVLNMRGCLDPGTTVPGGSYPDGKSLFGIYDMSGNVWEWVYDWYDEGTYADSASSNPFGPNAGTEKVVRSGSYLSRPERVTTTTRQIANPQRGYNDVGFRCVKTETVVPAGINLPPEGHLPDTPEEGVESEPPEAPMEVNRVEVFGTGFGCFDAVAGTYPVMFSMQVTPETWIPDHATVYTVGPTEAHSDPMDCTITPLGGGLYAVGCDAILPPDVMVGDLPEWIPSYFNVSFNDPASNLDFGSPMELNACPSPGGSLADGRASLSCPDAAGLRTLEIDQTQPVVPDMLAFELDGMSLEPFCTDFYADHITCTGLATSADPTLMVYARYPGSEEVFPDEVPLSIEDCPTPDYSFSTSANCHEGGGYAMVIRVTPVFPGAWEVTSDNVTITSSGMTTADTMQVLFSGLPPEGENIRFRVCLNDGGGGPLLCYDEETPQPDCLPPVSFLNVTLDAFGCDSGNFWVIFTHTVADLDISFLTVASNFSPMVCSIPVAPPNTVNCGSVMSPTISEIVFQYTEPGKNLVESWTIVPDLCEQEQLPCSSYTDQGSCLNHGCLWNNGICH
jgi:sulfatase modifying factor 1